MCGICGRFNFHPENRVEPALIRAMTATMVHRGPDADGYYIDGSLGLGHRRLSIIDLSGGDQPITNETGDIWIVFNGEIYNYSDLRDFLEARGHRFRTESDTEVIVHLYEERGLDCLTVLDGMFAFALWDAPKSRLLMARDRLGKKPLYYYCNNHFISFASELKGLLADREIPLDIDSRALFDYLRYGYVPTPRTIYRDIRKLEPGHWLVAELNGIIKQAPYWHLTFTDDLQESEHHIHETLRQLVQQAVKKRLVSDVPLGAFLSGGIDSSLIVGTMARFLNQPVKTFTIGFKEAAFDESSDAQKIASHFQTDHHTQFLEADKIEDLLPRLVSQFDEPFSDASALPTYYVSKFAREYVTVVLSGDGGDEVFAGYKRYLEEPRDTLFLNLPGLLRKHLIGSVAHLLPYGARGKRYFSYISDEAVARYRSRVGVFSDWDLRPLLKPDFIRQLSSNGQPDTLDHAYLGCSSGSSLSVMQHADIKTYLLDDILVKVDRMSMLNSLEVRSPFLDYHLIEYAARIPAALRLKNGQGKYILREAFRGFLPDSTFEKPKQGFGVPFEFWFRGSLSAFAQEHLSSPELEGLDMFDIKALTRLLIDHASGRRDNSPLIWNLLNLVYWKQTFARRPQLIPD
jgi:asparagine synthase (glutamine-hydrolysing)